MELLKTHLKQDHTPTKMSDVVAEAKVSAQKTNQLIIAASKGIEEQNKLYNSKRYET